jgi:uncharacterized protein (TIGR02001 family)
MKQLTKALVRAGVLSMASVALSAVAVNATAQTAPATPAPAAAPAAAPTPEHTLAPKISLYSEYEYRGISQTSEKPALQFNLDYSHSSGFYAGTFITNIKWLKDSAKAGGFSTGAQVEVDLFGGYKFEVAKDVTLDVGVLRYQYPSSKAFAFTPNTTEVYFGATAGPFSAKYSRTVYNLFGFGNSKGSGFTEINWSQEVFAKVTANAQIARQTVKNNSDFSYTVYKLGATYDIGDGWNVGGYFKDTNAKKGAYQPLDRDWSKARLVVFASKSF